MTNVKMLEQDIMFKIWWNTQYVPILKGQWILTCALRNERFWLLILILTFDLKGHSEWICLETQPKDLSLFLSINLP